MRQRTGFTAVAVLLVVQLALIGVGLAKANGEDGPAEPRIQVVDSAPDQLPLTPESGLPLAAQYAQQWRTDARLVGVSMRLDWPEVIDAIPQGELPPDGWLLYTYVSGEELLTINLDRGSGSFNGSNVSSQGGSDWKAIDIGSVQRTAAIAALSAELLGGRAYRSVCPDQRRVSVVSFGLVPRADGSKTATWTVTYEERDRGDRVDVRVRMDATTGDVIDDRTTSLGCDE